jgi:ribosomal RNA-processing protein 12
MDLLVFLKLMIPIFAKQSKQAKVRSRVEGLVQVLLSMPLKTSGNGNAILTQWVFDVLESLLNTEEDGSIDFSLVSSVVDSLLKMSPYENDSVLTPSWLGVITHGYARISEMVCDYENGKNADFEDEFLVYAQNNYASSICDLFQRIFQTLFDSKNDIKPVILEKATVLLSSLIENGVGNAMLKKAIEKYDNSELSVILTLIETSLTNIRFREKWGHILLICSAIFHVIFIFNIRD